MLLQKDYILVVYDEETSWRSEICHSSNNLIPRDIRMMTIMIMKNKICYIYHP